MSSVTIITLLIQTLFIYSHAAPAAAAASISDSAPFAIGSRSLLRSIEGDKSEKPDYGVELNATNFDSVLSETPATHAVVEFFAHWFVLEFFFFFLSKNLWVFLLVSSVFAERCFLYLCVFQLLFIGLEFTLIHWGLLKSFIGLEFPFKSLLAHRENSD